MDKLIYTLIDDIHAMLEQGVDVTDANIEQAIEHCTNEIRFALENVLQEGQRAANDRLRLSMVGKPDRQIWYTINFPQEQFVDGQTRIKFLMGHLMEAVVIMLARAAGHSVTGQQEKIKVGDIVGHQDCRIDDVLVDIKTASSFGMKKFKEGAEGLKRDDPFGYRSQLSSYARGDTEAAFLAIDKSSGEMVLTYLFEDDLIDAPKRVSHVKSMVKSPSPPEKCYEPVEDGQSGNMKLATGCVFCNYKHRCWADANDGQGLRVFQYSNGLKYLTSVEKEPKVEEIKQ